MIKIRKFRTHYIFSLILCIVHVKASKCLSSRSAKQNIPSLKHVRNSFWNFFQILPYTISFGYSLKVPALLESRYCSIMLPSFRRQHLRGESKGNDDTDNIKCSKLNNVFFLLRFMFFQCIIYF